MRNIIELEHFKKIGMGNRGKGREKIKKAEKGTKKGKTVIGAGARGSKGRTNACKNVKFYNIQHIVTTTCKASL